MYSKKISFENYRQFKDAIEIPLGDYDGTIGILGNNGSGKSTLLSGIAIALYGVDAITGKKEYIRTQGVEKEPVTIKYDFHHDGKDYSVTREFRGINLTPKASIFIIENEIPRLLATGTKEVNSYVEKILNMDYKTFVSTIFCKQKELDKLSNIEPAERRSFVLKLSGVDKIEDEIKSTRELRRDAEKFVAVFGDEVGKKDSVTQDIENLNITVDSLKSKFSEEDEKLKLKKKNLDDIEKDKISLDKKYETYNVLTLDMNNCKNNIGYGKKEEERLSKETDELNKLKSYMDKQGYKLIDEHKKIQDNLELLEKTKILFVQKQQIAANIEKIKKDGNTAGNEAKSIYKEACALGYKKDDIANIKNQIEEAQKNVDSTKSKIMNQQSDIRGLQVKLNDNNSELNKIKSLNNGHDSNCACPTCKQVVSSKYISIVEEHYNKVNSELNEKIIGINSELDNLKTKLSSENTTLSNLKLKEDELRNKEKRYSELLAQYNTIKKQYNLKLDEYKKASLEFKKYDNVIFDEESYKKIKEKKMNYDEKLKNVYIAADKVKNLDKTIADLNTIKSEISEYAKKLTKVTDDLEKLAFDYDTYQNVKKQFEELSKDYNEANADIQEVKNDIYAKDVTERKFLKQKLSDIEKKEKEYSSYKASVNDYTKIEEALMSTKNSIMKRINPLINKHFSEIFKTLIDDKYEDIELDEEYNIFVYDNGEAFPLSRFSGGEQDLANLALRLAISKFLAEMNKGNIEFIVLDEIFASLDDERKTSLLSVLGSLSDFFKQVIVISHEDVIKSSMDYYIMVKENEFGYSEIQAA